MRLYKLYFGRRLPNGSEVSESEVVDFIEGQIVPAFPQGFTILSALGYWRTAHGITYDESSFVLEVYAEANARTKRQLEGLRHWWCDTHNQDSVCMVSMACSVDIGG